MAQLTLAFLGPPSVECDGQPLEVDTRKAIALLAYLATTSQTQTRDALSTLLWPKYDQANARANLRRTLSALKRGLADQGDRHHEAALHNNLADLLYAEGRSEEAMVHLKQAVPISAEVGSAADPTQPEIWKLTEW